MIRLRWLALLSLAAMGLLGFTLFRYQRVRADLKAGEAVMRTLATDQRVALQGEQRIQVPGAPDVVARVLQSGNGKTRIEYVSGDLAGLTVWEDGKLTWRWDPGERKLTIMRRDRGAAPVADIRHRLLQENFDAHLVGEQQVAGIDAAVVELRPKKQSGTWKQLVVDLERNVVLASMDFAPNNALLRSTRFEKIEFDPAAASRDESFRPPQELVEKYGMARAGDSVSGFSPRELVQIVNFPVRLPGYLPDGYELEAGYPFPCKCHNPAAQLQFTNGLNTVVLSECGHQCPPEEKCVVPPGSDAFVVLVNQGGLAVAATGDVPRSELEKMAKSVFNSPPVARPHSPRPPQEPHEEHKR